MELLRPKKKSKRVKYTHNAEDNFLSRIAPEGDCIAWRGAVVENGYGVIRANGKQVVVHRYAWERVNGKIPVGMELDHICHNRTCVKVDHLRVASRSENMRNLSGASHNSTSGVRNVSKYKNGGWRVRLTKDGVEHSYGIYQTIEEASTVAEKARKELFGEFAGKG